jgi:hypothetical protein
MMDDAKLNNCILWIHMWQNESETECQRFLVMYLESSGGRQIAYSHKESIGCIYWQTKYSNAPCPIMKISVNQASTILGHVSWIIWGATGCI